MARKAVFRSLAALPKAPRWQEGENKSEKLFKILREVAERLRKDEPQAFYSLREVQRHFSVSMSTAVNVYSRLEEEGILIRLRGSKTLLQGKEPYREIRIRGLIGMPISESRLMASRDYLSFFQQVPRELRMHRFVAQMLWFTPEQLRTGDLSDRLKRFQTDTVIWFAPESIAHDTILRLRESGIRVIGICDGGLPPIRCSGEVRRRRAILQILRTWRSGVGLRRVTVLSVSGRGAAVDEQRMQALLEEEGWEFEFAKLSAVHPQIPLESSRFGPECGFLLPSSAASLLSFFAPELFIKLVRTRRAALIDGPINVPFPRFPEEAWVDLIYVDWHKVTRQIVNRVMAGSWDETRPPLVFEAEAGMRAAASAYAHSF